MTQNWKARRTALAAAAVLCVLAPAPASAHIRSTAGYAEIREDGGVVRYRLSLERDYLAAAATGTGKRALQAYLTERVMVAVDGVQCDGALEATGRERRDGREYATIVLAYECPGSPDGAYVVRYGVFSETDAVVDDHTSVTDYQLGGARGIFVFDAGHRELDVGKAGPLSSASRFATMGVEHILSGLDHVLFLVALLLGARGFRSVVKLATAFTVAHSLTLALAALGWVRVPAEIVEPLIALSIAYVAAENILGGESRHRLAVVFGFGLLHGLGFASTLSFTGDVTGRLLASLVTFNVGIELGQALIIAALFLLLLLLRRHRWSAAAHAGAAVIAATVGLTWFFDRLLA
jgi:hydrogenase/urease accessory protein HupE